MLKDVPRSLMTLIKAAGPVIRNSEWLAELCTSILVLDSLMLLGLTSPIVIPLSLVITRDTMGLDVIRLSKIHQ